jgi:hypothetical protein
MSSKDTIKQNITQVMQVLADEASWPVPFSMIERLVDQVVADWYEDIEADISGLIKDWESRMDDDKTLYSLGLRRALDVFRGSSPTL